MRIDSSGNVGIGETSPKNKVDIGGNLGLYGGDATNGAQLYLGNGAFNNSSYYNSAPGIGAVGPYGGVSGGLAFYCYQNIPNSRTETMRIDSAGRVTMPYQPLMQVYNPSDTYSTGIINYWTVQANVGNHYNSSTGYFTCPVAGQYFVYCSLWRNSGTCDIAIQKNGTDTVRVRNSTVNDQRDNACYILTCSANDTIAFNITQVGNILGSSIHTGTLTSAFIYLIG
jgi:hypothetical protein